LLSPAKINNSKARNPRVLVAPLDWGLGHATRCIPIIKELINQKCEVIIAAVGAQKAVLQGEFPFLTFVKLPGYNIIYDKNRALTILRLLGAIPKILIRIKQEKAWLRQFLESEKPDLVISDNRYGLALPGVFCVFVTHQLRISTSFGRLADALLQRINYRLIGQFSRCWVPDIETGDGLAGTLSHPARLPFTPTRYIGLLSRFGKFSQQQRVESSAADGPELLILLSGPEPQRSLLEASIISQANGNTGTIMNKGTIVLVRGLPAGGPKLAQIPPAMTVFDHLPADELEQLMSKVRLIVARSGYSTVMDLARLGKRALLIPTPGQPEQEYLGPFLAGKGRAVCVRQSAFSLQEALALARRRPEESLAPEPEDGALAAEIKAVLAMLDPGDEG
jgi:UDP:flavonoid glycosyltransferase YjiC (YdhE family)